jgi:hypothetical protein
VVPSGSPDSCFIEAARLQFGPNWENGRMAMMVAYCDESYRTDAPALFTITGVLSNSIEWFELGRRWRRMLVKHGLEKDGFHMSDCENATVHTPYEAMPRPERDAIQRDFLGIICDTPMGAAITALEATEFPKLKALIESQPHFDQRFVIKPYYSAFQHTVATLSRVLDDAKFVENERVAFTFDRTQEFSPIALKLYGDLQNDPGVPFRHRLGSIKFESRLAEVQLQAADVLAYEGMRYVRDVMLKKEKPRWQYTMLAQAKHPDELNVYLLDVSGAVVSSSASAPSEVPSS